MKTQAEKELFQIAVDTLNFYADRKNFQLIFDNPKESRAEVYERYSNYSIGDFGIKAREALDIIKRYSNES